MPSLSLQNRVHRHRRVIPSLIPEHEARTSRSIEHAPPPLRANPTPDPPHLPPGPTVAKGFATMCPHVCVCTSEASLRPAHASRGRMCQDAKHGPQQAIALLSLSVTGAASRAFRDSSAYTACYQRRFVLYVRLLRVSTEPLAGRTAISGFPPFRRT